MKKGYQSHRILERVFLREGELPGEGVFQLLIDWKTDEIPLPGQFIMLRLDGIFLPRPMSISGFSKGILTLTIRTKGRGTRALATISEGTELEIMGPLGKGCFPMPEAGKRPLLLAGGMGFAPLLFLHDVFRQKGIDHDFLYGESTKTDLCIDIRDIIIATLDGSKGYGGTIVDLMRMRMLDYPADYHIYTCGPEAMYRNLKAQDLRYPCHVSLEEHMACGIGACYGCVTPVSGGRRVCLDGPVFPLSEVEL